MTFLSPPLPRMKACLAFAILAFGLLFAPLRSTAAEETTVNVAPLTVKLLPYWKKTQTIVAAVRADVNKGGLQAIGSHVAELEEALAAADKRFAAARQADNTIAILVDGRTESVKAPLRYVLAPGGKTSDRIIAVNNPYPSAALLLGTYYNEIGRVPDALRVLDAGLALPSPLPGELLGETLPNLTTERAIALIGLKRFGEALVAYDGGLRIPNLDNKYRGRMLRGRGLALTELGRLDEAEKSYRDSLVTDPNNPIAMRELDYIARLRKNPTKAPIELVTPNSPARK